MSTFFQDYSVFVKECGCGWPVRRVQLAVEVKVSCAPLCSIKWISLEMPVSSWTFLRLLYLCEYVRDHCLLVKISRIIISLWTCLRSLYLSQHLQVIVALWIFWNYCMSVEECGWGRAFGRLQFVIEVKVSCRPLWSIAWLLWDCCTSVKRFLVIVSLWTAWHVCIFVNNLKSLYLCEQFQDCCILAHF